MIEQLEEVMAKLLYGNGRYGNTGCQYFKGGIQDLNSLSTSQRTGKSFSEALILASVNPQYDKRLFIEFP